VILHLSIVKPKYLLLLRQGSSIGMIGLVVLIFEYINRYFLLVIIFESRICSVHEEYSFFYDIHCRTKQSNRPIW